MTTEATNTPDASGSPLERQVRPLAEYLTGRKGMRVVGDRNERFWRSRFKYHAAHKAGRMYLCGCIGAFRVGCTQKLATGKSVKRMAKASKYRRQTVRRKPWIKAA